MAIQPDEIGGAAADPAVSWMESPATGSTPLPNLPLKLDGQRPSPATPPPSVGADTRAVLAELGYTAAAINALIAQNVVGAPAEPERGRGGVAAPSTAAIVTGEAHRWSRATSSSSCRTSTIPASWVHMGHPRVQTPSMDRLAARGTAFTAAYTNCPICVPARASFATGRYVHEIGYWDNAIAWDGRVKGWPNRLQEEDLYNATIGKLHYRREEDPYGIDRQIEPMHIYNGIGMVWGSQRDPLPDTRGSFRMLKNIGPGESGYNRYDGRIADEAVAWLREASTHEFPRPWVLYIGFVAPHFPLVAPQKYFDPYPIEDMPFPKLHPRNVYTRHPWVEEHAQFSQTDSQFADEEERLLAIAAYHALCTFVDERIGAVLDTLDETGLSETTRVVYTSDHGDNVGARGLWGKSVLYEEASRIPMIVAGPDVPEGRTVATLVTLVDLYPTVLDGVGLDATEDEAALPGRSLFAIADEGGRSRAASPCRNTMPSAPTAPVSCCARAGSSIIIMSAMRRNCSTSRPIPKN